MAKNGQLWDDSALVKALDDAISKYKIMHDKGGDNGSLKEEGITKDTEESSPKSNEAKSSCVETDNITLTEKCTSEVVAQHAIPSNGDQVQDSYYSNVNTESAEQYNLLLNQYNAVEEQRQKLLQQLYQYGNWDTQGYSYDYGAGYDSQYHTVSAPQTSGPPACTCRPYVCPYSTSSAHNGNSASVEDDGFIKAAKGAVDKAIRSFDKEGKQEQEGETTSQTDLSAVLNAWFSAGFYTGKYLSEQASAKK
ncbi:putative survival motor neuron-like protein [Helianthus annuus]|nr:putative survival motor neuron-like protein [Helianthus annuus]